MKLDSVKEVLLVLRNIHKHESIMNMRGKFCTKAKSVRTKGQVSIFLVFLFQVLFVFFAMIINVGLLVYYKINLQNSVDLAAYYAAMKQAEMLNTIGHINYQIRQSWKLLAYRTTLLGTLGPDSHPARPLVLNTDNFKPAPPEIPYADEKGEPKMPVFCITISEIYASALGLTSGVINDKDNQCKSDIAHNLSGFKIPEVIWTLPGFNEQIREGAIALQDKFLGEFAGGGFRNYNTLASFIIMFRADSMNRRKVMAVLANTMSKSPNDFSDIEGHSVAEGARKVLLKNLADQNSATASLQLYNPMADTNCGGANPDVEALPGWLKEVEVAALFAYMDSKINQDVFDGPGKAQQGIHLIGFGDSSLPSEVHNAGQAALEAFQQLNVLLTQAGLPQHSAGRWTTAVGVEKNPWCMPYIGIKATSTPKLPFMPARFSPQLQARTFAKPFGSKIGPWYGRSWPDRNTNSTSDKNNDLITDKRLPPRLYEGMGAPPSMGPKDQIRFFANYSRFVGDKLGLLSQAARWAYGKFYWAPRPNNPYWTSMWKGPLMEAFEKNKNDNSPFFMGPLSGDILADAYQPKYFTQDTAQAIKFAREMRASELAAIAPDLFDITYYPIETRFNQYLLPNLERFIQVYNSKRPNLMVRGDLGWRAQTYPGEPGLADVSANVEMQIEQFKGSAFYQKTPNQIFQTIATPDQTLTSWAERSIIDYDPSLASDKLGKCTARIPASEILWSPGGCNKGGRTGYSVKVVSKKFLTNSIPDIGGQGVSGTILNPPPADF